MVQRKKDFPCISCKEHVKKNDKAVKCACCDLFEHKECSGMSDTMFKLICEIDKEGGQQIWSCNSCSKALKRISTSVAQLEKRVVTAENNIQKNTEDVEKVTAKTDKLEDDMKTLQQNRERDKNDIVQEATRTWNNEQSERESKKSNVIIYGAPEAEPSVKASHLRKAQDNATLKDIFNSINHEVNIEEDIKFCIRTGPLDDSVIDNPRPILLGFRKLELREKLFNSAKNLATSKYKYISIAPDLTKMQREKDKHDMAEVNRLNNEMSEEEAENFIFRCVGKKGERVIIKSKRLPEFQERYNRNQRARDQNQIQSRGAGTGSNLVPILSRGGQNLRGQNRGGQHHGDQYRGGQHRRGQNRGGQYHGGQHHGGQHRGGPHQGGQHRESQQPGGHGAQHSIDEADVETNQRDDEMYSEDESSAMEDNMDNRKRKGRNREDEDQASPQNRRPRITQ